MMFHVRVLPEPKEHDGSFYLEIEMARLNWEKARRQKQGIDYRRSMKEERSLRRTLRKSQMFHKSKQKSPNKNYHPKWDAKCDAVLKKLTDKFISEGTSYNHALIKAYQWICKKLDSGEWK